MNFDRYYLSAGDRTGMLGTRCEPVRVGFAVCMLGPILGDAAYPSIGSIGFAFSDNQH